MVSSAPRPYFTPGKDLVSILQETEWVPGPVWTGGKSHPHRDFFFNIFAFILQMFETYYNRSGIDKPEIRKI